MRTHMQRNISRGHGAKLCDGDAALPRIPCRYKNKGELLGISYAGNELENGKVFLPKVLGFYLRRSTIPSHFLAPFRLL